MKYIIWKGLNLTCTKCEYDNECEWWMIFRDQCRCALCATLRRPCVWRDSRSDKPFTFRPFAHECRRHTLHWNSHKWMHSYTHSMFSIFFVASAFIIQIRISHKWNRSFRLGKNWIYLRSSVDAVVPAQHAGFELQSFLRNQRKWNQGD